MGNTTFKNLASCLLISTALTGSLITAAHATSPVTGTIGRRIATAPATADAIRFALYGDGSGGTLEVQLSQGRATSGAPEIAPYYASPAIPLDFKGWKIVTLPLSDFKPMAPFHVKGKMELPALTSASVDGLNLALSGVTARVYIDNLAWATAGAGETDPALALIDGFDVAPTVWKPMGDAYQNRAIGYVMNTAAGYVKSGPGSLQLAVRNPGLKEKDVNATVWQKRLAKPPAKPYVAYTRPPFDLITEDSVPSLAEVPTTKVSVALFLDESEPVNIAIYSTKALKNATWKAVGPFQSASKKFSLPAEAFDIRVVTPEGFLVKDDRIPLSPDATVRLTGDPSTDVAANTSKPFYLTVKTTKKTLPATYTGKLVFSADGVAPTTLTLTVDVLPLTLKTAFLQYGTDITAHLADSGDGPKVTPDQLKLLLNDLKDHGVRLASFPDTGSFLEQEVKAYRDAALSPNGPLVIAKPLGGKGDIEAVEAMRQSLLLPPDFAFYYTLPTNDPLSFAQAARAASKSAQLVAPIDSRASYDALGDALDVPVFSFTSDYGQTLLQTGKRQTNTFTDRDWVSWNLTAPSATQSRALSGLLLYKTGLNGPTVYGAFPGPYPSATADGPKVVYLTAYSVVDSLAWEAFREGIDDIRYFGALKTFHREILSAKTNKAETTAAQAYLDMVFKKNLLTLTPKEQADVRQGLATQALNLARILRSKGILIQ